jgi:hypothetical protein
MKARLLFSAVKQSPSRSVFGWITAEANGIPLQLQYFIALLLDFRIVCNP